MGFDFKITIFCSIPLVGFQNNTRESFKKYSAIFASWGVRSTLLFIQIPSFFLILDQVLNDKNDFFEDILPCCLEAGQNKFLQAPFFP